MRASNIINSDITEINKEMVELETRRDQSDRELSEIKDNYEMLIDADEIQDRIQRLSTNRELLTEAIQERNEQLDELNQELEKAESKEVRESRIKDCIKQAQRANKFNRKYIDLMESLDVELVEKIAEINTSHSQLATAAKSFFNTLELLEPAAKRKSNDPSNDSELQHSVKAILNIIEERGDVDTATARSEQFTRPYYHRKTVGSIDSPKVDHFGHWIYEMMKKHRARMSREAAE